jgi:thiol-disulfide isomerase/thioredoxin
MKSSWMALVGLFLGTSLPFTLILTAPLRAGSPSQDDPADSKPRTLVAGESGASLQSINEDYARQLLELERQRLSRLARLAMHQPPIEASETYEQLFRLAISNNLFREAEPAAREVMKSGANSPPVVHFLARTIDIIASADRGAYEESLTELRTLLDSVSRQNRAGTPVTASLDTPALLVICEAYYQRLLQGDQFDAARKAFQLLFKEVNNPAIKDFSASRLTQLDMIGKPAPPIQGTDLDGKPLNLADWNGNVVLVVFWASWCLPCAEEVAILDHVYTTYQNNVRWPNLINGSGTSDYAKAYGVTEIPANVLIGRDGNVTHFGLSPRKNLASVIAKVVAP